MDKRHRHTSCTCKQPDFSIDTLADLPSYQYQELSSPTSTRVFEVFPGKTGEHLRGRLSQIEPGDKKTSYIALSYAWGSTRDTHRVECDGCSIKINCNLLCALTRIHQNRQRRSVRLFVDAICINQSNEPKPLKEREAQVKQMGRIYGEAEFVIVDLGNGTVHPTAAISFLNHLAEFSDELWRKIISAPNGPSQTGLPCLNSAVWDSLASFCSSTWFGRLWVAQEFALANDILLSCGCPSSIRPDALHRGLTRAIQLHINLTTDDRHLGPNGKNNPELEKRIDHLMYQLSWASTRFGSIFSLRAKFHNVRPSIAADSTVRVESMQQKTQSLITQKRDCGSEVSMLELLVLTCDLSVTDQRDRVYALLGMTKSQSCSALEVNYSESTELLSRRVSSYLAESGHVLELIYCLASFDNKRLSSWMINLESRKNLDMINIQGLTSPDLRSNKDFKASHFIPPSFTFNRQSQLLLISGCITDEIVELSSASPYFTDYRNHAIDTSDIRASTFDWELEAHQIASDHAQHLSKDQCSITFWKTLVAGARLDYHHEGLSSLLDDLPAAIGEHEALVKNMNSSKNKEPTSTHASKTLFQTAVEEACNRRRFCITRKVRMGLVPPESRIGDKILILLGGPLPLVARKINDAYRLIGMAYINDIMDGEAIQDDDCKVQDILLD